MSAFSEKMLALRKARKLNQEEAAKQSGIGYRSYRRYETGEREPGIAELIKMADYFNVSVDYLIGRTENPMINR